MRTIAAVLILVVLIGLGGIGFLAQKVFDVPSAARELPGMMDKARSMGIPLEAKDILPQEPIRDADNAAPLLWNAFQNLPQKVRAETTEVKRRFDHGEIRQAKTYLARCQTSLAFVDQASKKTKLDFHREWDRGIFVPFPEFGEIRAVMRLLTVRAQINAKENQPAKVFADLELMQRLAVLEEQEPTLIPYLVAVAIRRVQLDTVERVATIWANDDRRLADLESLVRHIPDAPPIDGSLKSEVFLVVAGIRNLESAPKRTRTIRLKTTGMPDSTINRAYLTRYLQEIMMIWPKIDGAGEHPEALAEAEAMVKRRRPFMSGRSYALTRELIDFGFSKAAKTMMPLTSHRRSALSFIRVLRYRAQHRSLPETLAEAHAEGIDPWTGKSLSYLRSGTGFRIYSVGGDRRDDRGRTIGELPKDSKASFDEASVFPPLIRNN